MRFRSGHVHFWLALAMSLVVRPLKLPAGDITFVVPPGFENQEGDTHSPDLTSPLRALFRYSQDYFSQLPATPHLIKGFALRPDRTVTEPRVVDFHHLTLVMSTAESDELADTFSASHGPDPVTVFDGELVLTTNASGPEDGPRPFDYRFAFDTPYLYDSSQGHLMLEFIALQGYSPALLDDSQNTGEIVEIANLDLSDNAPYRLSNLLVTEFTFASVVQPGDFDGDGRLTSIDIDDLMRQAAGHGNPPAYDLNTDLLVNDADITSWVKDLAHTWFGDADLNGEFNSADFVQVFQAGKYETQQAAGWAAGDWNADLMFDSSDFVTGFVDGGYEQGPRTGVAAVPEPGAWTLLVMGLAILHRKRGELPCPDEVRPFVPLG